MRDFLGRRLELGEQRFFRPLLSLTTIPRPRWRHRRPIKPSGQKNSLIAKLNAANNQLGAFLNELRAYVNAGKVSGAAANTLRAAVHAVQAALGTYNRFLEWWPLEA